MPTQMIRRSDNRFGTVLENVADMMVAGNHRNARKTCCDRGHEFTPENTYRPPSRPHTRQCRECTRIRARKVTA